MNIGMICYPSYGGSGVVATELGIKLAHWGHQVHFISYERPFRLDLFNENIFLHEVEITDYPLFKFPPYSLALASKIVEVAKTTKLDILHVHYAIPHTTSAFLAKRILEKQDLPVITTLHGTDITIVGNDQQFYDIVRFGIKISDGVTAVSENLKEETLKVFGVNKDIRTIYNFVDPEEYKRLTCKCIRQHYAADGEKIVIHISNFRPVKRLTDIIEVFAGINQSVPSKLLLVGDGPDRMAAQEKADSLGIKDKVFFLGKQERVVELLSIADLFLLPSEKESFGLVALEAMACEVPVIASDAGGLPEVVAHGRTGFLASVGDVSSMIRRGIEILENDEIRNRMGQEGRRLALNKFHIDNIVRQYEDYYHEFTS